MMSTASWTCVQYIHPSLVRHPAGDASTGWYCHQWTSVHGSARHSRTIACFNCSTFSNFLPWYTRSSRLQGPKWHNPPGLSPGCCMATYPVRWRWYSDAAGTRWCSEPCATARRPAAESTCSDHTWLWYPATDLVRAHECSSSRCWLWRLAPQTRYWFCPPLTQPLTPSRCGWSVHALAPNDSLETYRPMFGRLELLYRVTSAARTLELAIDCYIKLLHHCWNEQKKR